jgi:hypothetical protein
MVHGANETHAEIRAFAHYFCKQFRDSLSINGLRRQYRANQQALDRFNYLQQSLQQEVYPLQGIKVCDY